MYCTNPHTHLEIKADGGVYCCCEGWLPTPLGNLFDTDLMSIWRSKLAQDIRHTTNAGGFQYCTSCPYLPDGGGPVWQGGPADLPEITERVGMLKLDYDQSCQLTCPSCRTSHSRTWVDEPRVGEIHRRVLESGVLEITDTVYVTGAGDPFASILYWHFLRDLPAPPALPNLSVFLHTNGLLLDPRHWDELGPTRDRVTTVGISVDAGTEMTYRTNRGGSFGKLWNNIAFLQEMRENYANNGRPGGRSLRLGMFYTVQANNYAELPMFLRMAFNHSADWVSVTALRNWGTYGDEDFRRRAVHLPEHPEHDLFMKILQQPLLHDKRIVLDSFNPSYIRQETVINPNAILPRRRP
jgi:radical SAM protein with 4Fe4S-binding SPASM domain